jgi:UDP-N-acetyl-D-galactosamine dehydrogenase
VIDIVKRLEEYYIKFFIFDPWADPGEVNREYSVDCQREAIDGRKFDAIILAVAHDEFRALDTLQLRKEVSVVYDVKSVLNTSLIDGRL